MTTLPMPCDRCLAVAPLTWDGHQLLCPQCLAGVEAAEEDAGEET